MFAKMRKYFISGLIVFLPVAVTIYLFAWAINFTDGILGKYLQPIIYNRFGFYFRGLSIIILVYLVMIIGFFVTNYFGRKIYLFFENLMIRVPFFKQVYPAFKEIALFLFSRDKLSFKQVIIVEYPRKGIYSFGFLTNESNKEINKKTGHEMCNVFLPSAPGPVTGYVVMIPKKDISYTYISVEAAIKFNVSGGVVNPYSCSEQNGKK